MYFLVNDIKEKACAVSLDFCADLKLAKQTEFLKLQYVLRGLESVSSSWSIMFPRFSTA